MGQTKIEWTATQNDDGTITPGYTFNPWIGCTKVSPGCKHCYAEAMNTRYGWTKWGPQGDRKRTSAVNWRKPLAWNRQAAREGRRYKVFCASLADVFEDNEQIHLWQFNLWDWIEDTPNLDWLLLTKRPENIAKLTQRWSSLWSWPDNVWLGTSVENQATADERIPELLKIPAKIRFLSCEPLLEPIDLGLFDIDYPDYISDDDPGKPFTYPSKIGQLLDWVIIGGESGPRARPFDLAWAESIIAQCAAAGVPCFVKQLGSNPVDGLNGQKSGYPVTGKGGDMAEWPKALRVREWPNISEVKV